MSEADKGRPGNPAYVARISSRANEQPTPLPTAVVGSLHAFSNTRPSSLEIDRPQFDKSVRATNESDENFYRGVKPRKERSIKADPAIITSTLTTPSMLQRRASMLPRRGSNPNLNGKRMSRGASAARLSVLNDGDGESHESFAHLPGTVADATPQPKERSDAKLQRVAIEPSSNTLQQRARRVSQTVPAQGRTSQTKQAARQRGSYDGPDDEDAEHRTARTSRTSRGAKIGSGVWNYNHVASMDEDADGGADGSHLLHGDRGQGAGGGPSDRHRKSTSPQHGKRGVRPAKEMSAVSGRSGGHAVHGHGHGHDVSKVRRGNETDRSDPQPPCSAPAHVCSLSSISRF